MVNDRYVPVKVPESELARQASTAFEGYIYQLHQTVLAWLALGPDELMHIEVAEDFSISDNEELELVQVKRTAASLTLRSDGVAKLITAVWRFQSKNPSRRVSAALLTTSVIGKEKGISFPGDAPGLIYWRTAARANSDVEPIRNALLHIELPQELKAFIQGAAPDKLRTKIIRPIRWVDASAAQDELVRDIEDKLVILGSRHGVAATASKNALAFLVNRLLDCILKPADMRYVTAADLLETFQSKTFVTVPLGLLEGLTIPEAASPLTEIGTTTRDLAQIPLPSRTAQRAEVVEQLGTILVSTGRLWLHGSSGVGKTTLALLLAESQSVSWRFADLRDLASPALRSVLHGIASSFRQSGARGLILDDIPADPDNALVFAIGQVARVVAAADAVLIITSAKPPPPTLSGRLELKGEAVAQVPYLTEDDVCEMVRKGGGDPANWTRSILASTSGHPQLVDARVSGLSQRGWDKTEILAEILPIAHIYVAIWRSNAKLSATGCSRNYRRTRTSCCFGFRYSMASSTEKWRSKLRIHHPPFPKAEFSSISLSVLGSKALAGNTTGFRRS